jgi:hypothetical protein
MAFRKFGGLDYNKASNYVSSNTTNTANTNVLELGSLNTKVIVNSHLDLNNQSLISVNNIYFTNGTDLLSLLGTSLSTPLSMPKLKISNPIVPTLIYPNSSIGQVTNLEFRDIYGYSGWYTNSIINWKFNPKITTVAELHGITIDFFNGNNTDTFFVTIYTRVTGDDYSPNFHSSMTYAYNKSILPNTEYKASLMVDDGIQFQPFYSNGSFSESDIIQSVVIGTSTEIEFVLSKINFIYSNVTHSYLMAN